MNPKERGGRTGVDERAMSPGTSLAILLVVTVVLVGALALIVFVAGA